MFEHWDSFYLLIGGASGALIGLLFIVATLTRDFTRDQALAGSAVYMAPVVGHLAIVLSVSAFATAPPTDPRLASAVVGAGALVGLFWTWRIAWLLKTEERFETSHWTDIWWYGVGPAAIYVALAAAAAAAWISPRLADWAIGALLVALMLVAIRNAWDLVTWISATSNDPTAGKKGTSGDD